MVSLDVSLREKCFVLLRSEECYKCNWITVICNAF